jgi:hypothetical protein
MGAVIDGVFLAGMSAQQQLNAVIVKQASSGFIESSSNEQVKMRLCDQALRRWLATTLLCLVWT